ncbi:hypothetical protein E1508_23960 [Pseudomonas moraviensis]|nr:hypothetical protein E1508_23960 [Pseudomonas moraviensis]
MPARSVACAGAAAASRCTPRYSSRRRRLFPCSNNSSTHAKPCGSEPARESGSSASQSATDTPPSRAGSLPQGRLHQGLALRPAMCLR